MEEGSTGPDPAAPPTADPAAAPPPRPAGSQPSEPSGSGHALSAVQRLMIRNLHRSSTSGQQGQQKEEQREQREQQQQAQPEERRQQQGASQQPQQQGHTACAATAVAAEQPPAGEKPPAGEGEALDAGNGAPHVSKCNASSEGAEAGQPTSTPPAAATAACGHLDAEGVVQQLPAPGSELPLPPAAAEEAEAEAAAEAAAAQAAGEGGAVQPAAAPAGAANPVPQAAAAGSGVPLEEEEEASAAGEPAGGQRDSEEAAGGQAERVPSSTGAAGGEQADGPPNLAAALPGASAASAGLLAAQQAVAGGAAQEEVGAADIAAVLQLTGVQATAQGNWQTQMYAPLDSCGRVVAGATKIQRTTGRFSDRLEAAVARDLCVIWRDLRLGCDPARASETFNCPLNSLLQQEALLGQLKECPSLRDLRQLLEGLAATGHLRSLADTLLMQRTAAVAAALGQAPGPAQSPQAANDGQAAAGCGADVFSAAAGTTNAGSAAAAAAAAEASGTADGGTDANPPAGATISAAQAADVVASAAAIFAAVAAGPSAAQPGAAPTPSRGKAFVGVQQVGNSWMAHLTVGVDEQLRPSGIAKKKGYSVGSFGSAEEGAAARDVAIVWRCLVLGASPHKAYEKLNLPLDGLLQQEALLGQLKLCPSLRDLRQLLAGLAVTGELRRLAATLLTQRNAAVAAATWGHATAAAAAAAAPAAVDQPSPASVAPTATDPPTAAAAAAAGDRVEAPGSSAGPAAAAALPKQLLVGITRLDRGWQAGMWVSLDEQQRLSSSARRVSKSLGCFSSMEEAALARDIAVIWKQLGVGASPHAASEKLNAPIGSLLQQDALLGQLKECPSLRDLRQLLEGLAATGHLRSLAATLLTQRTAAVAAAIGEQQAAPAALPPGGPTAAATLGPNQATAAASADLPGGTAAVSGQAGGPEQQPSGEAASLALRQPSAGVEPAAHHAPTSVPLGGTPLPGAAADAAARAASGHQGVVAPVRRCKRRRRKGNLAGVTLRGCKWQATTNIGLTSEGRVSDAVDRAARAVGCFATIQEAGIARDLGISWRQLALGTSLEAASEPYNARLPMLLRESALLAQLQRCATWDELRTQLQRDAEQGKLAELAERLLPPAMSAAAAAAAGQHPAPDVPSGKRLRARAPIKYEEGAGAEDSEEDGQRPAKRRTPDGQAAVGRCVEVWLGEGSSRQPYTGLVVERIPSGKHHVLFSDGEEALLDFEEEDVRYIECPTEAAAVAEAARAASKPADAAAVAAAKRDKGQRLRVLWPDGQWWSGRITYAVGTGLHCIQYDDDSSELLVDVMEEQVKWHSTERQQEHERVLRQYRREQRAAGKDGPAAHASPQQGSVAATAADSTPRPAKRGGEQQQQQHEGEGGRSSQARGRQRKKQRPTAEPTDALACIKAEAEEAAMGPLVAPAATPPLNPGSPGGQSAATGLAGRAAERATPPVATPAAPAASGPACGGAPAGQGASQVEEGAGDLFDYLMGCAEAPGAEAAGLTGELVCQYQELLDALQPPARAAKEERLRKQLAAGKFGNAAAMMRMAVNLALGKPPGMA